MKKIMILLAAMAMSTLAIQAEEVAQPVAVEMTTAATDAPAAATVEDDKNATENKSQG